jgi:hypothetical protein
VKKPTLVEALARKVPEPPPEPPAPAPARAKIRDARTTTTLRIDPERLEALKILAAKRRGRVNDLVLEGIDHVLALYAKKS